MFCSTTLFALLFCCTATLLPHHFIYLLSLNLVVLLYSNLVVLLYSNCVAFTYCMYSNYFEPIQHFFLLSCLREYVEFNCPLCSGPGRPWGHVAVPWRTTSYSAWGRGAGPRGSSPTPRGWQSPTPAGSSSQTQTTSVYRLDQQYLCTG